LQLVQNFDDKSVSEAFARPTVELDEFTHKWKIVSELIEDTVRELPLYEDRILCEIKRERLVTVLDIIHKWQHVQEGDVSRQYINVCVEC